MVVLQYKLWADIEFNFASGQVTPAFQNTKDQHTSTTTFAWKWDGNPSLDGSMWITTSWKQGP